MSAFVIRSLLHPFHFISSTRATGQEDQWAARQRRCRVSQSVHLSTSVSIFFIINNVKGSFPDTHSLLLLQCWNWFLCTVRSLWCRGSSVSTLRNPELMLLVSPHTFCLGISWCCSCRLILYVTCFMLLRLLFGFFFRLPEAMEAKSRAP